MNRIETSEGTVIEERTIPIFRSPSCYSPNAHSRVKGLSSHFHGTHNEQSHLLTQDISCA